MIFYFSGTGNSQLAAVILGEILGDQVVSINRRLKENRRETYRSHRPLVFAAPTYAWRMPRVVERWILESRFEGNRDAYFVLTCGGSCGGAEAHAKKLCAKAGLRFCGLAPVVMPENYLAMFPTPGEAECQEILERAKPRIAALGEEIRAGGSFAPTRVSAAGWLQSGPVNPLFYALFVGDKGFAASELCVSCGKCVRRCPLNNIRLAGGRPVWQGNCTHCMACIGSCPTGAIEYKSNSRGRRRYDILEEIPEEEGGQTP